MLRSGAAKCVDLQASGFSKNGSEVHFRLTIMSKSPLNDASDKTKYPELPPLRHDSTDVLLEAFSHRSLDMQAGPDTSPNNQRLVQLGKSTLHFAATYHIFSQRPIVEANQIPVSSISKRLIHNFTIPSADSEGLCDNPWSFCEMGPPLQSTAKAQVSLV